MAPSGLRLKAIGQHFEVGVDLGTLVAGVDGADPVLAATEQVGLQAGFGLFCDGLKMPQRPFGVELPMTMVSGASSSANFCRLQYCWCRAEWLAANPGFPPNRRTGFSTPPPRMVVTSLAGAAERGVQFSLAVCTCSSAFCSDWVLR